MFTRTAVAWRIQLEPPIIIVQARMSSSRLPGKVMKTVAGQPLLGYLLDRLEKIENKQRVVVATSEDNSDDPINLYCDTRQIECLRGPLNNVAERIYQALEKTHAKAFVRISADSPLLDPALVEKAQKVFFRTKAELATNVLRRTYPKGMSVEVVDTTAFQKAYVKMTDVEDREHVTRIFYREPNIWRIAEFSSEKDLHRINLSVDTESDFQNFKRIIARMQRPHWTYGLNEILRLGVEEE